MKYSERFVIDKNRVVWSISIGVVLSIILGFGNFTQTIFINGVVGQANSIYESLTPVGFTQSQSFIDWILGFYFIGHLPLSIVACYIALKQKQLRPLFLAFTIGTLLVLTITDTLFSLFKPELSSTLIESYLSNALGSPVIAFFLCLILLCTKKFSEQINLKRDTFKSLIPIIICAISFFVIFVIVQNLFFVTKSKVSAIVKPPFRVSYGASLVKEEENRFGVFWNTHAPPEKLAWTGKLVKMKLATGHAEKNPTVTLFLFEGCPNKKTTELLELRSIPVIPNLTTKKIGFAIDDGMGNFSIYSTKKVNGHWNTAGEKAIMFSVRPAENKKDLVITTFSSEDMTLFHQDWEGETYYRFDAFLMGEHQLQTRYAAISTDNGTETFAIAPNPRTKVYENFQCRPLSASNNYVAEGLVVTALLKIAYPKAEVYEDLEIEHETRISGLNGWLSVDGVSPNELSNYFSDGQLDLLSVQGPFEDLIVDNENKQLRRENWLYLQDGTVSASVLDGSVKFDAETDIAALEGQRISKTRWEKIAPAIKWLFVLLPGLFGYLLKVFWDAWKRNEIIVSKTAI